MKNKFIKKIMAASMVGVSMLTPMSTVFCADPRPTLVLNGEQKVQMMLAVLDAAASYLDDRFGNFKRNCGSKDFTMTKKLRDWGLTPQYLQSLALSAGSSFMALRSSKQTLNDFNPSTQDGFLGNTMKGYGLSTWTAIDIIKDFIIDKDSKFSRVLTDYGKIREDVITYLYACGISVDGEECNDDVDESVAVVREYISTVVFFTLVFNLSQIEMFVNHNTDTHARVDAKNSICYVDPITVVKNLSPGKFKRSIGNILELCSIDAKK